MSSHQFCTVHRIAYNTSMEYNCPQCTLAHTNAPQLAFDSQAQLPLSEDGKLLDKATLAPAALFDPMTGARRS